MRKHREFDPVRVQVEKAVRALEFVAHRLGRSLFASEEMRAKWMHDLKVIRRLNNLKSIAAEYFGADQTVLFEHEIGFSPKDHAKGLSIDSAGGVELPVFPPAIIREHRVVMTEYDAAQRSLYKHLLVIDWMTVERLKRAKGTSVQSEHHARITKGINTASLFVSELARHHGRVTYVAKGRRFAFAEDETLGRAVWLHVCHAPQGFVFRQGMRVSYVVVDVPNGLQGRDIRAA